MSRDPDDHSPRDPNQLHKYLFASGDPVNRIDPRGRGDLFEVEIEDTWIEKSETIAIKVLVVSICTTYTFEALDVLGIEGLGKDIGGGVGGYVCALLLEGE
jgi:hypothetical protein